MGVLVDAAAHEHNGLLWIDRQLYTTGGIARPTAILDFQHSSARARAGPLVWLLHADPPRCRQSGYQPKSGRALLQHLTHRVGRRLQVQRVGAAAASCFGCCSLLSSLARPSTAQQQLMPVCSCCCCSCQMAPLWLVLASRKLPLNAALIEYLHAHAQLAVYKSRAGGVIHHRDRGGLWAKQNISIPPVRQLFLAPLLALEPSRESKTRARAFNLQ